MRTVARVLALSVLLWGLTACNNTKKGVISFQNIETECLGSELDGSYTVRAWGIGRNSVDAMEQARKNAVRDFIFQGVSKGQGCEIRPILFEVNAKDKYQNYFNRFFADNGEYRHYVSMRDRRPGSWIHSRKKGGIICGIIVRVKHADLKAKLAEDGILKTE